MKFLDEANQILEALGIDLEGATLDHIAYQTESSEEYDRMRPEFEKVAQLIKEPLVSERRVGVFKFNEPLLYKDQKIKAIELIEPVEGQKCISGLEHAEYMLPVSLEEFIERYPNVDWNMKALNREQFPMLILRLSDTMRVKFPRYSILS